jgi:hypothetical protein
MKPPHHRLLGMVALAALLSPPADARAGEPPDARAAQDFFETSIRPVLAETCQKCHGPGKQSSGLRLDSRQAMLQGGSSGPAIVPGNPDESLLVQAVAQTHDEVKMPPKGRLPEASIAALRRWVEMGAPWGEPASPQRSGTTNGDLTRSHWAFTPLGRAAAQAVKDHSWVQTPIDGYVLARLEQAGMTPSPPADRRTLIRRATIDLLGVPPTSSEIEAFLADRAPSAFDRVLDRLLASPLYGERWGRHWLDVARYADTKGYVFQEERKYPFAFTYRDYVIRSFNADLPFDRFVLQQIAADQLDFGVDPKPLAAMGFLTVGRRFLNDQNEIIDDRIDLIGRGLLGLSIGCARCHDHKFDPIPSEDYYSLYGVFASSIEPDELPRLDAPGSKPAPLEAATRRQIDAARRARDDFLAARRAEIESDFRDRFSRYLAAAYDLELNPRHPALDERAGRDKLVPQRLRSAILLWKRRLETSGAANDPVLGPLRAFSDLAPSEFQARSLTLVRGLRASVPGKSGGTHPLVVKCLQEQPPASLDQAVGRYRDLSSKLEAARREKHSRPADPLWESLRMAFFGPDGILVVPADNPRLLLDRPQRQRYTELNNTVKQLEAKSAGRSGRAMVMRDAPQPVDPHVFIRGNPGRPGKAVPRQFLNVLAGSHRRPFQKGSGRLELARAIVDPGNPLTARVLVNRVWHWHFGQGLVTTPSDLGLRSDRPSHPELLDALARSFIDSGWSIKSLHRRIMLSSTYQQRSELRPECQPRDPQNRLLWRFNRQRLDFETLRDSVLAVAGSLDLTQGGPSLAINEPPFPPRRTVYGLIDRQNLDGVYRTFDFSVPDASSPKRFVTTVPQQALFLMNSPFIQEQASRLAAVAKNRRPDDANKAVCERGVQQVYQRVLGRPPGDREQLLAEAFLGHCDRSPGELSPLAQLAQVLMLTNEFMFVD